MLVKVSVRRRLQRGEGGAQRGEGVLVKAHPQVQPMLLNALSGRRVPSARALAAEAPAPRPERDLEALPKLRGRTQPESGGDAAAAAAKNRNSGSDHLRRRQASMSAPLLARQRSPGIAEDSSAAFTTFGYAFTVKYR